MHNICLIFDKTRKNYKRKGKKKVKSKTKINSTPTIWYVGRGRGRGGGGGGEITHVFICLGHFCLVLLVIYARVCL